MTRTRLLLLLLASLSIASALVAQQPTRLKLAGPTLWVRLDTVGTWVIVPGSTRDVFNQTRDVYQALKIKIDIVDSAIGQVGASGFQQTGSYAGRRMSAWIRCGEGLTGPNADTWRISMAVLSQVERVSRDSTRVRTLTVASARNMAEGSATPMMCATSGQMEAMINQKVLDFATGRDSLKAEKKKP